MTKNAIDNILNAITDLILEKWREGKFGIPGGRIIYGPELASPCLSITPGPGGPEDVHLDKGMVNRLPITINGKDIDMEELLGSLYSIHELLTQKTDYSDLFISGRWEASEDYQVIDIETTASPAIIGREGNTSGAPWLAGSSIEVTFYQYK
jgi:hypothetical protein